MAMVIWAGLQSGCGSNEEAAVPPSGPKAVILAMLESIAAGDADTAVSYYDCSVEDREHLMRTMPFYQTTMKLDDVGAKAYGRDVWEAAKDKAGISGTVPDMVAAKKDLQCTIEGDTAICKLEEYPRTWKLKKKGERWLIVPQEGQFPTMHRRGEVLKATFAAKTAIDAIMAKIETKNGLADDICAEVKAKITAKDQ